MLSFKKVKTIVAVSTLALGLGTTAVAHNSHQVLESVHFLIPGGAGGGWDGTARGTGEALTKSGLLGKASYENMSGGGGGKAIGYLIENAKSNYGTMMVNSTPIVIRSLRGVFPHNFRDLTLIASVIGDYEVFAVHKDSPIKNMADLVNAYKKDPRGTAIGGGSAPGGMDHIFAALVMEGAGVDPTKVKYIPYDAGGQAMAGLLSGEVAALSTGFSEAIEMAKAGEARIIGVGSDKPIEEYPDIPTIKSQGIDVVFANWRGFFAAPGLPEARLKKYRELIDKVFWTPEWDVVRKRNGWVEIYNSGDDFRAFLEQQEKDLGTLLKKLGFL